jgi:hypothetical protein
MSNSIAPFPIAVAEADLDDLRHRLDSARFPAELPDSGWDYGTEQAFLRSVIDRWRDGYLQTPRVWAERRYNLVHYSVRDRGGHFAAFEQPQLFAADLNTYGDRLRELGVF